MIVFKFGGASVKSADAVRNVGDILKRYPKEQIAIVVSAMGKTTNAMEDIADHYFHKRKKELTKALEERKDYHRGIVAELFPDELIDTLAYQTASDAYLIMEQPDMAKLAMAKVDEYIQLNSY